MFRLKLSGSRWAGFTGHLGTVDFKDGISVDPVSDRIADRLSAAMPMVLIDEKGREVGEAGVVPRLLRESAHRQAEVRASLDRQTEAERKAEDLQIALQEAKSPTDSFYSQEQLQAIADEKGIKGLRLVAEPWNVKGKAIPALIEQILASQNKFLEARKGTIQAVADVQKEIESEVVEEKGEETPTETIIQEAAISGDLSAAISIAAQGQNEILLGSDAFASSYEIDGKTVMLGELVGVAHQLSGATAAEWNELADADREDLIRAELDRRLPKV